MTGPPDAPPVVNGWRLFAHSLFLEQLEALIGEVERARRRDPERYVRSNAAKRLAAITKLAFEVIPQDPTRALYRQGDTLGSEYTHWFRATFFQQFRIFFRYSSDDRTIIYVWVNDEHSRRAYGSRTDAYRVFRRMLASGDPPDSWDHLMSHATANTRRLRRAAPPDDPDA
ncbi:MAG: type II toxin-antitoxin system YhaV family toxin [Trueperaceae bacterium]|nr:MAG: type II toxin-antitoxin system YhaV family toxin [Trueperaceae bacterium]